MEKQDAIKMILAIEEKYKAAREIANRQSDESMSKWYEGQENGYYESISTIRKMAGISFNEYVDIVIAAEKGD
jgi:hypothetical protein